MEDKSWHEIKIDLLYGLILRLTIRSHIDHVGELRTPFDFIGGKIITHSYIRNNKIEGEHITYLF